MISDVPTLPLYARYSGEAFRSALLASVITSALIYFADRWLSGSGLGISPIRLFAICMVGSCLIVAVSTLLRVNSLLSVGIRSSIAAGCVLFVAQSTGLSMSAEARDAVVALGLCVAIMDAIFVGLVLRDRSGGR